MFYRTFSEKVFMCLLTKFCILEIYFVRFDFNRVTERLELMCEYVKLVVYTSDYMLNLVILVCSMRNYISEDYRS